MMSVRIDCLQAELTRVQRISSFVAFRTFLFTPVQSQILAEHMLHMLAYEALVYRGVLGMKMDCKK